MTRLPRLNLPLPRRLALCTLILSGLQGPGPSHAAFTYPGCEDAAEAQFRYVPVVGRNIPVNTGSPHKQPLAVDGSLLEPLHLAFDPRPDGKADIYYVEKAGKVKRFDAVANTVSEVGTVSGMSTGGEMGLSGIALDPGFKENRWIYLFFAQGSPAEFRLSRFTLTTTGKLDNTQQKVLLKFRRSGENHTGGAMAFDASGDLWITVGKNAKDYPNSYHETTENLSTEATSANLADYRGGILRIHPDNSARGYSIPPGNFGEYWSAQFKAQGRTDLAAEYADPAKVLPEIYVKGTRNAYSIAVHPTRRWMAWGEFGVNTSNTFTEEHNLVTRPSFGGYPYFAGGFGGGAGSAYYNLWSGTGAGVYNAAHPGLAQSIAGPVNRSVWNKGPTQLPPVTPALHTYMHGAGAGAVTGPIYSYDPASKSPFKWPPHFEGAWFVTDWVQGSGNNGFKGAKIFKLNAAGNAKVDSVKWFQNLDWFEPISMDQGPDGGIYVIMYHGWHTATSGTHIGRLEYTGSCRPGVSTASPAWPRSLDGLRLESGFLRVPEVGGIRVTIWDGQGRRFDAGEFHGPARLDLRAWLRGKGLRFVSVETASGIRALPWIGL